MKQDAHNIVIVDKRVSFGSRRWSMLLVISTESQVNWDKGTLITELVSFL